MGSTAEKAGLIAAIEQVNGAGRALTGMDLIKIFGTSRIRAEDLVEFLTAPVPGSPTGLPDAVGEERGSQAFRPLALESVTIEGPFTLHGVGLKAPLRLRACEFTGAVDLSGAHLPGADFTACVFRDGFFAPGLQMGGDLGLEGITCQGRADFSNAVVKGSLLLAGASFDVTWPPEGDEGVDTQALRSSATVSPALALSGAQIWDRLDLDAARIIGGAYLLGLELSGTLTARGATISNPGYTALFMDGATIAGHALFDSRGEGAAKPRDEHNIEKDTKIEGSLRFNNAAVVGDMCLGRLRVKASGLAVSLDQSIIGGALSLDRGFSATGRVSGRQMRVGGPVHLSGAVVSPRSGAAVDFTRASIHSDLIIARGHRHDKLYMPSALKGGLTLADARVRGRLALRGTIITRAHGAAVQATGARIDGGFFIDQDAQLGGSVVLDRALVRGGANFGKSKIEAGAQLSERRVQRDLREGKGTSVFHKWFSSNGGQQSFARWISERPGENAFLNWVRSDSGSRHFDPWARRAETPNRDRWIRSGKAAESWVESGSAEAQFRAFAAKEPGRTGLMAWAEHASLGELEARWRQALPALSAKKAEFDLVTLYPSLELDGSASFEGAKVKDRAMFHLDGFGGQGPTGLSLQEAIVEGALSLRAKALKPGFYINLEAASARELDDRRETWPAPGNLVLSGLQFERFGAGAPLAYGDRRKWVAAQTTGKGTGGWSLAPSVGADAGIGADAGTGAGTQGAKSYSGKGGAKRAVAQRYGATLPMDRTIYGPLIAALTRHGERRTASRFAHAQGLAGLRGKTTLGALALAPLNWLCGLGYRPGRLVMWVVMALLLSTLLTTTATREGALQASAGDAGALSEQPALAALDHSLRNFVPFLDAAPLTGTDYRVVADLKALPVGDLPLANQVALPEPVRSIALPGLSAGALSGFFTGLQLFGWLASALFLLCLGRRLRQG